MLILKTMKTFSQHQMAIYAFPNQMTLSSLRCALRKLLLPLGLFLFFATFATAQTKTAKISYDRLVCVKFKNDLPVYAENGRLTDYGAGILHILTPLSELGTYSKLIDMSEQELDEQRNTAQRYWDDVARENPREPAQIVGDMNNYFMLELKPGSDAKSLIRRLKGNPAIEYAANMPEPVAPTVPGNFVPNQTYLNVGAGINANQVYSAYSNRGAGIRVVDIEYQYNTDHADLPAGIPMVAGTQMYTGFGPNHGTAVMGELVSRNNGWGTTGIAAACTPMFAGAHTTAGVYNLANSIVLASAAIQPGDIILLEQQMRGPYHTGSGDFGFVPVEYNFAVFQAIQTAVGNNRNVVEAAANGFQNLNDPLNAQGDNNHNPFSTANSGAILVGAGASAPAGSTTARSRLGFSNYGTRVSVQGFGENVTTTGYGGAYSAEGVNYHYTNTFSGTSSASPIVTGACALVQSVYKNATGSILTPAQMRSYLISTGQAQQSGINPASQNIGPLPNAYAAAQTAISANTCGAPTAIQFSATNITATSVRINCTTPGNAYDWTYRPAGGAWVSLPHGTANYVDIAGLTPNTQYEFSAGVRCNNNVWSAWSASKSFTTLSNTCGEPTLNEISVTAITATSARLKCSTPVSAFDWTYRPVGGAWVNLSVTSDYYVDITGLTPNTQYEFAVGIRCNNNVWSGWSPTKLFTTLNNICDAPAVAEISATAITSTTARLKCSTPAVAYDWTYRPLGGVWVNLPATTNYYIDIAGLSPNTKYEYAVGVKCTNDIWSTWSATRTFITTGPTGPDNGGNKNQEVVATTDEEEVGTGAEDRSKMSHEPGTTPEIDITAMATVGTIYPNPTTGAATLPYSLPESGTVNITVTDQLGRVLYQQLQDQDAGEYQVTLSLDEFITGRYAVRFQSGKAIRVQQLVVIK